MTETRRIKIHTNNSCNLKCRFCYYGDSACIKEKDATFLELKKQLKIAKDLGALDVDFSGGEPTIVKEFPELISYAKLIGFRTICVITNGLKMSNKEYTKRLVDAGLNDVLFSLEGHNSKTHDYLTRVPGSFNKIIKAIKNVKDFGVKCRINITITKENYKVLDKFAKLILKFKPDAVNFIKFNPWGAALNSAKEMSPKYSNISPHIKEAIDILDPHVIKITVRYIPFCFMQDYEKHVCNYAHLKYDIDEWWIPSIQYKIHEKSFKYYAEFTQRVIKNIPNLLKVKPSLSFDKMITRLAIKKLYTKPRQCKKCKYFYICDGIDKPYPSLYGTKEIKPILGNKIKDPMFFRGSYLEKYEKKYNF